MLERKGFGFAFGAAQVRSNYKPSAIGKNLLERGQRGTHTGIVRDVAVIVQRYVKIYSYKSCFSFEVEIFDVHGSV